MRVFFINAVPYGSTGKIMFRLADAVKKHGGEAFCTTGYTWVKGDFDSYFITSGLVEKTYHMIMSRVTGKNGMFSKRATKQLICFIERYQPDIIHLHNLHGWFVNLPMLFEFLKQKNIPVIWTLHDCWSFTGHCPHYTMIGCEKWKNHCNHCSQYNIYPGSMVDRSSEMYDYKKRWFNGVKDLTISAPSEWMKRQVEQSFLSNYPVEVINNGIDLRLFFPKCSNIRDKLKLGKHYVVLGVAYSWDEKKGLDVFIELASRLGEGYRIILVGIDNKEANKLPDRIIPIQRTHSQKELAELYSAADVFVNPTREDTFPTVNMEALACGTPVISFSTGGSPEIIDQTCGIVVPPNDLDALASAIHQVCEKSLFPKESCRRKAAGFSIDLFEEKYYSLYRSVYDRPTEKRDGTAVLL